MSEDFQEKTEEATPKKLSDARRKGQVAKSQDLTSSFILFVGMIAFYFFGPFLYRQLAQLATGVFLNLTEPIDTVDAVVMWVRAGLFYIVVMVVPIMMTLLVTGILINVVQVGWHISTESLNPKLNKVNPFDPKNWKKFFSVQAVARLVFGLAKMAVIGVVCYWIIQAKIGDVTALMNGSAADIFAFLVTTAFQIGMAIAIILVVLGILEFLVQKWKFMKDMKMSRTEVKDERKQTEGDVQVKGKMRSMMQSMAQSRMRDAVPHADVVIANPIHFSIAIRYDPENMHAPLCVAKGARRMALMIRGIAEEHGVPVVENPPLAQGLYRVVEVGQFIPPEFYHAVAEVLAHIYRLNQEVQQSLPR